MRQWAPRESDPPGGAVAGLILVVADVQERLFNVMDADADAFPEPSKRLR